MVVPIVGLVEGVLNGIFVEAKEFQVFIEAWNGRPVTLRHPKVGSRFVSANSPNEINTFRIGQLFNSRMEGKKFLAEAWIDLSKTESLGEDAEGLVENLKGKEPKLEVSTGYFAFVEAGEGTYNGTKYTHKAFGFRPDHLAMLPDEEGACSWEDGCGAPRTNEQTSEGEAAMEPLVLFTIAKEGEQFSFSERARLLMTALGGESAKLRYRLLDVFDNFFAYESSDPKKDYLDPTRVTTFRREYSIGEQAEVSLGSKEIVRRKTLYVRAKESGEEGYDFPPRAFTVLVTNQEGMSFQDLQSSMVDFLQNEDKSKTYWIEDVWPDVAVYLAFDSKTGPGNSPLYRREYSINGEKVEFVAEKTEVTRKIVYVENAQAPAEAASSEEHNSEEEVLVEEQQQLTEVRGFVQRLKDALGGVLGNEEGGVENAEPCGCPDGENINGNRTEETTVNRTEELVARLGDVSDEDRAVLMTLSEEGLKLLVPEPGTDEETIVANSEEEETIESNSEETNTEETEVNTQSTEPKTKEAWLAECPIPELRDNFLEVEENRKAEKKALVEALVGNSRCQFEQPELSAMSIKDLKRLATLAELPRDFSGQGGKGVVNRPQASPAAPTPEPVFGRHSGAAA